MSHYENILLREKEKEKAKYVTLNIALLTFLIFLFNVKY